MIRNQRPLWQHPLFQRPLIALCFCLIAAALFGIFGFGRPNIAVAIALDLSSSTYQPQAFNAPGTIMQQEVAAVKAYLEVNSKLPSNPNTIQVFGIGGGKAPALTSNFSADTKKVEAELGRALQDPNLPKSIQPEPPQDSLDVPIRQALNAFKTAPSSCREIVIVSDAGIELSPQSVSEATAQKVKINGITFGGKSFEPLKQATVQTGGIYISGADVNLNTSFTEKIFPKLNSNIKWVIFWLGAAWIALMWTLTMPLDRWLFQGMMKMNMTVAGKAALGNAFFWTAFTPSIIWKLVGLPIFGDGC